MTGRDSATHDIVLDRANENMRTGSDRVDLDRNLLCKLPGYLYAGPLIIEA